MHFTEREAEFVAFRLPFTTHKRIRIGDDNVTFIARRYQYNQFSPIDVIYSRNPDMPDPSNTESRQYPHWREFKDDLLNKLQSPPQHPTFILYFIAVMLGVGLIGTWKELLDAIKNQVCPDVTGSISTYAIAVVASAFAEVVLSDKQDSSKESNPRQWTPAFRMFALFMVVVSVGTGVAALELKWPFLAIAAAILSLLLWWVVNADNPTFKEPQMEEATPIGPIDPEADLQGTLDNLKT